MKSQPIKKKFDDYVSTLHWVTGQNNEKGDPMEFDNHPFLMDIYDDQSQYLCVMKAAQIGMSTLQILKNHRDAKANKMDIIYTLPTDADVRVFVSGKVNRIIANNSDMLKDVADKDSIEQKQVGNSMIYFRGTWTKKAAIMVTADRLVHDEKDSSKLDVVSDYQARLQHSKFKQIHTFSHPSLPEVGVDADWIKSDQKHWHITCPHCGYFHYMDWNIENPRKMSVDIEKEVYVCKKCKGELSDKDRACGQWVAKYPGRKWSGYWIPMLIAPWVSAADIVEKYKDPNTTDEFFYQKVLGLPYADASSKLLRDSFYQNLTGKGYAPYYTERVVIGVDTGLKLDYVMGDRTGLFYHGMCEDYDQLDELMRRWPKMIAVVDQGGDLIGSRKFYAKWPGRVYLCALTGDRNTKQLIKWSKKNESGACTADRNRMIQLCVDEFRKGIIPVHGTEDDWYEFWLDWNNLAKIKVLDPETNQIKGYKWVRNGRDHRALATVFWRVGISRFLGDGAMVNEPSTEMKTNSYLINPDNTVDVDLTKMFDLMDDEKDDWRKT